MCRREAKLSSCHEKTFVTKITRKLWVCKLARLCRVTCLCHNLIFLKKLIMRFILSYFYFEDSPLFLSFYEKFRTDINIPSVISSIFAIKNV